MLRTVSRPDGDRPLKLISFSLWGEDPKYCVGALSNAKLAPKIYPGWLCRFYVGADESELDAASSHGGTLSRTLRELARMDHVQLKFRGKPTDWQGLFWRFYPGGEADVRVFLSRDCDSRLNRREASAVRAWLASPKLIHVMRDHPYHYVPIMAGMWGAKRGAIPDVQGLVDSWQGKDRWQTDQDFLHDVIWSRYSDQILAHDDWNRYSEAETRGFPTPRTGNEFVGAVIGPDEERASVGDHTMLGNGG